MSRADNSFGARKEWALKMQTRFAVPIYKAYWKINGGQITEVDAYAKEEEAAQKIDASGIDKMVEPETGVRHVAQRFRSRCELDDGTIIDPDFSIRTGTYSNVETEYDKLLNAYRNKGNVPQIYAFGIGASVSRQDCLQTGFKDFYFLDLPRFLKLTDNGTVQACSSYKNGDGSKALYFDIQTLRNNQVVTTEISGNVLASCWNGENASGDFPTAPGIKSTGQLNLCDFGSEAE